MGLNSAQVSSLQQFILAEVFLAFGLPPGAWGRRILAPFFWLPARRFARLAAQVDDQVARHGLRGAAQRNLNRFVRGVQVRGAERVPREGPLLIAANHTGAADALALAASLPREDLQVVVSGIPFLRGMPHAGRYFLYADPDPHRRMLVFREMVRWLEGGGSLLLFASQDVDPDPAFMPGASAALERWSSSIALCLQRAPAVSLVIAITSGVLAPRWMHSRLIRVRQGTIARQKLAEFLQVSRQMLLGGDYGLEPRVTFSEPCKLEDLGGGSRAAVMDAVIARARAVLYDHVSGWPPSPEEIDG